MFDGASGPMLGRAVGTAAPSVARQLARQWRLAGTFESAWLELRTVGGESHSLTATQVIDVEAFVASDKVRPLLALLVISRLVGEDDGDLFATIRKQFETEARRWCADSKGKWDRSAPAVWERLVEVLDRGLPTRSRVASLAAEVDQLNPLPRTQLALPTGGSLAAKAAGRLVELATDLGRVGAALELAASVAAQERELKMPPIMSHADMENPPDFAVLYVPRSLVLQGSDEVMSSRDVVQSEAPFRVVLVGNPGAGKSTFVRNLVHELAQLDSGNMGGQASVVVRCREYLKSGSFREPILDYVNASLRTMGVESDDRALPDALLLGQVVVVFDGLDEVTQVQQRSEMVQRVEAFAANFPLASILVTSRELGYHRAPLSDETFQLVALREFSDSQVAEYAHKWFTARNSVHLIDPFLRESETVVDLRRSPLLLSLLCVLYRARGTIPRRRLDVYSRCADLLFYTWDSQRQIEQPEELPKYGDRLMQAVARWVFASSTAQQGIPERSLEGVMTVYLKDLGVAEDEARRRAMDFVGFVAGRAWLLGAIGTSQVGERLFGFTHRTFYEYFTAEALARESNDAQQVCEHIRSAFERDETSVLPELLIQAFDNKQDRGAPEVFKMLCQGPTSAGLVLRLMDGSLLPSGVRKLGFDRIVSAWERDASKVSLDALDALLTLESSAFAQFVDDFVDNADVPAARRLLTDAWARCYLLHREHHASDLVVETVGRIAGSLVASDDDSSDWMTRNWLVACGAQPLPNADTWHYLARPDTGSLPGAIPAVLARRLHARNGPSDEVVTQVLGTWLSSLASGFPVPDSIARRLVVVADPAVHSDLDPKTFVDLAALDQVERLMFEAMLAIAMIGVETGRQPKAAWFQDVAAARAGTLGNGPKATAEHGQRILSLCKPFPEWARLWIVGRHSLVGPMSQGSTSAGARNDAGVPSPNNLSALRFSTQS